MKRGNVKHGHWRWPKPGLQKLWNGKKLPGLRPSNTRRVNERRLSEPSFVRKSNLCGHKEPLQGPHDKNQLRCQRRW
jgi:hypothetical protein